jgi:hypothetical protein
VTHFLIVFDRRQGRVLREEPYDDHRDALDERFRIEKQHKGDPDIEVVVLSAASAEALRHTHARYFMTLSEIARQEPPTSRGARAS